MFIKVYSLLKPQCLIKNYKSCHTANILKALDSHKTGDRIKLNGWVKSLRNQKENVFIDLCDGSTPKKLQIFVTKSLKPKELTTGSSITVEGALSLSPKGQVELTAEKLEVCGKCVVADGYPFAPRKQYNPEYVRQHLHFRPRTNKFSSLLRVRNAATLAIHNYFNSEGYFNVHTPILTPNDCEGAGEVFKVVPDNKQILKAIEKPGVPIDELYFNTKTFLSVSGQLHLEAAAHGLSKVYTLGPTFRAENSRSRLHLSEFYMLEAEVAFLEKIEPLTQIIEKLIKNVTQSVLNTNKDDIDQCCKYDCNKESSPDFNWLNKEFPVITYKEAVEILKKTNSVSRKGQFKESDGFSKEQEIFLVKHCGNVPTFVINWPKIMKPFYMRECTNESDNVSALDLLAPVTGELVGGSLRENNYEKLKEKLPKGSNNLDWYLDIRKFGGVPTGGFGLGFERYLQFLLGIENIKDTIPFPRWPHNCSV